MNGKWFLLVALVVFGESVAIAYTVLIKEQEEWNAFKVTRECKVLAKTQGYTSVGTLVNTNGTMGFGNIYHPGSTNYLCNDGIIYERTN